MHGTLKDESDVSQMMEIAQRAARDAGAYLVQKLGFAKIAYQKAPHDDLLDVDLEAERIILKKLSEETPLLGFLSEEAGYGGDRHDYWIVDPLDGSANFQHGSPAFGIAIALVCNQTTTGGIIYLPIMDEMFVAIQGQGASLNGRQIKVSTIETLGEALVHVGDFAKHKDPQTIAERLTDISKLAAHVRRIRMIGTAATDLAYVACGRADMLVHHTAHLWDIEAGKLLVLEAGGKATTRRNDNSTTLSIYSNGRIHQAAETLLIS